MLARAKVPELDIETRIAGFQGIAIGYNDEQAEKEAKRCLHCDLRSQIACNPNPPRTWQPFENEYVNRAPETEGVFQLLDADHNILAIKGTANLRRELLFALEDNEDAKMYSQRESELIQKYLQKHGKMPGGGADDLDDLY